MTFRVSIAQDDRELREVQRLLLNACLAARALKACPEWKDPATGLGATGLYNRLIQFAGQMTDGADLAALRVGTAREDQQAQAVFEDISAWRREGGSGHGQPLDHVSLSLHQLEWVADALWHTLRFDKAAYPRADELAFQISLFASGVFIQRVDLVTAAQLAHVVLPQTAIASWFRRHEDGSAPLKMREFYDAIARILSAQYGGYLAHINGGSADGGQPLRGMQSIAFSTNFDLEMENALHRSPDLKAFHVVVPVNAYAYDDPQPDLQWLFGTVRKTHDVESPHWEWFPRKRMLKTSELKGPIVIRLHGSPLHSLPTPDELDPNDDISSSYDRLEHAIVMSEREYLQNIVWKDPLPAYFDTMLQQKSRVLFFLGHFLDEWNTRLRLYSQVRRRDTPPFNGKRIAISRSHDPHRSALLSGIGIHRWIGDLEDLSRAVDGVLG